MQSHPPVGGILCGAGLVIHQNNRGVVRAAGKGCCQIRSGLAMGRGGEVSYTGKHQMRAVAGQNRMGVEQQGHAKAGEVLHPFGIVEKIFVVAGNRKHTIRRMQVFQRGNIIPAHGYGAINKIPGHKDHVSTGGIGTVHNGLCPARREETADVQISQLEQAVAFKSRRQAGNGNRDIPHRRHPNRSGNRNGCQHASDTRCGKAHEIGDGDKVPAHQGVDQRAQIQHDLQKR